MASQTEIVNVVFRIANPQQFQQLQQLRQGAQRVDINVTANLDKNFQRIFQIADKKIAITVDTRNATQELSKLKQRIDEIQRAITIDLNPGRAIRTPQGAQYFSTVTLGQQLTRQLRDINPQAAQDILGQFGVQNYNFRQIQGRQDQERALTSLRQALGIDEQGKSTAGQTFRSAQSASRLREAVFRQEIRQRQAEREFQLQNSIGANRQELAENIALKYGQNRDFASGLLRRNPQVNAFDLGRVANLPSAIQLGFAGLFGGLPGVAGGLLGGALKGPEGIFLGSAITQGLSKQVTETFEKISNTLREAARAGLEFQRSIVGISAVLSANTVLTNKQTGQPLGAEETLRIQTNRAREIQLGARAGLLPIGIAGESEAALVRAIVGGAGQRGINLSAGGAATLARRFGGTISAVNPQILQNPTQLVRDIEDILLGLPQATRTTIGATIRPEVEKIRTARSEEDLLNATKRLEEFYNAIKNSDQAAVSILKFSAAINNLNTQVGDKLLTILSPGINALADSLNRPEIAKGITNIASLFGELGNTILEFASKLDVSNDNLKKAFKNPAFSALINILTGRQVNTETFAEGLDVGEKKQRTLDVINTINTAIEESNIETNPTPQSRLQRLQREAGVNEELYGLRARTISQITPADTVRQASIQISDLNEKIANLTEQIKAASEATSDANAPEVEKIRLQREVAEAEKTELENKKALAQIQQQLNQIDQFTLQGRREALELIEQQQIRQGISPDVAGAARRRGEQNIQIESLESFNSLTKGFESFRDTIENIRFSFTELNIQVEESTNALEEFQKSARLRELNRQTGIAGLANQIVSLGKELGYEGTTALPSIVPGGFSLPTDEEGFKRLQLEQLQAQFEQQTRSLEIAPVEEQNQETRLRITVEKTTSELEKLPRAFRDAADAFSILLVQVKQKFQDQINQLTAAGTLEGNPALNLLNQLGTQAEGFINTRLQEIQTEGESNFAGFGGQTFAKGGITELNKVSLLGEEGPELFIPKIPGVVLNSKATKTVQQLFKQYENTPYITEILKQIIFTRPEKINDLFKTYKFGEFASPGGLEGIGRESSKLLEHLVGKGFANGGLTSPGTASLAGEYGEELFIPTTPQGLQNLIGSQVIPRALVENLANKRTAFSSNINQSQQQFAMHVREAQQVFAKALNPSSRIAFPQFNQNLSILGSNVSTINAGQFNPASAGSSAKVFQAMDAKLGQLLIQLNSQNQVKNYALGSRQGIQQAFGAG